MNQVGTVCLFLILLSVGTLEAMAMSSWVSPQEPPPPLPPIIPAIKRVAGNGHEIHEIKVSNVEQGAPVKASATLRLSQRAYGDGFLTLKNVSGRPILMLGGVWEISTSEGGVIRDGWTFGAAIHLLNGGLRPGEEVKLPVAGPPNFIVDPPHRITEFSVKVTGVVFQDRTYWGEDGYLVYRKMEQDRKNMLIVAERLRQSCQTSPQEVIKQLNDPQSTRALGAKALFPDLGYRIMFRETLVDENNSLRSDVIQRLDRIIAALKGN